MLSEDFKKRVIPVLSFLVTGLMMAALFSFSGGKIKTGKLKIIFINTANNKQVYLRDSIYINSFGEKYSVSKLKYYISNFSIGGKEQPLESERHHLINAADSINSFALTLEPGDYNSVSFLLGVDSISNCSGAQTGALDPMNDMFWTWNSGYVVFKLEGTSSVSPADLHRIEHHIGGYRGNQDVTTAVKLELPLSQLIRVKENNLTELVIETDLDRYWKCSRETKISEDPICTLPGPLAKKLASNFAGMFSIYSLK